MLKLKFKTNQNGIRIAKSIQVTDLGDASRIFQQYRDGSGIGADDLDSKVMVLDDDRTVAIISYNGRVWGPGNNLIQEAA